MWETCVREASVDVLFDHGWSCMLGRCHCAYMKSHPLCHSQLINLEFNPPSMPELLTEVTAKTAKTHSYADLAQST